MTGPEHYRLSEELLNITADAGDPDAVTIATKAHAHATLALAAAQIETGCAVSASAGGTPFPGHEWNDVIA